MKEWYMLRSKVVEAENWEEVMTELAHKVDAEIGKIIEKNETLSARNLILAVCKQFKCERLSNRVTPNPYLTAEQKMLNLIFADKDKLAEIRKNFEDKLVAHGWERKEYADWNLLRKGGVLITTRDIDLDISSGLFQGRFDYSDIEFRTFEDEGEVLFLSGCRCDMTANECNDVIPIEPETDVVSKKDLNQWIEQRPQDWKDCQEEEMPDSVKVCLDWLKEDFTL